MFELRFLLPSILGILCIQLFEVSKSFFALSTQTGDCALFTKTGGEAVGKVELNPGPKAWSKSLFVPDTHIQFPRHKPIKQPNAQQSETTITVCCHQSIVSTRTMTMFRENIPSKVLPVKRKALSKQTAMRSAMSLRNMLQPAPLLKPLTRKSTNGLPTKRPKTVRFAETATRIIVQAPTAEQVEAQWMNDEDYRQVLAQRQETVRAVVQARGDWHKLDSEKHCLTGLEQNLSHQQILSRKAASLRYRQLILSEQHFQKSCGFQDAEALRSLSTLFSKQSGRSAHLRAILDQAMSDTA